MGKLSNIPARLGEDPDFRCRKCLGNAWATDRRPCVEVQLGDEKLDVVGIFIYLSDILVQVEVVSLPLLRDATLHRKNLDNSYSCLLVKHFL